jgi:signal transduction histidine kinase
VAAIESEPQKRGILATLRRRRKRGIRLTLRLRLTLLYGACFLVAGAAVLGITYGLVAHDTGKQQAQYFVRGVKIAGPGGNFGAAIIAASRSSSLPSRTQTPAVARGTETIELPTGSGGAISVHGPQVSSGLVTVVKGGKHTEVTPAQAAHLLSQQVTAFRRAAQDRVNVLTRQANVALSLQRTSSLSSLLTWSAIALALMALVSIGLGWLVAGRALAPMRTMNTRARMITAESLHERLGIEERDDELGDLAAAFDELLARLERAFDSQRRFVANASHELRTPLTLERTLVEIALGDPEASVESLRRVCERVLASTEQQERLIEALLTLARSQAGSEVGTPVDLADVVGDMLLTREARLNGIAVRSELEPAVVVGDEALLERLVANLIDNAALHNNVQDPWMQVRTGELDGQPGIVIANSGPWIPQARVKELFEPFRRLEVDRTSGSDGVGLGLSIVQAIANAHRATLTTRTLADGGLEIDVRFPAAAANPNKTVGDPL